MLLAAERLQGGKKMKIKKTIEFETPRILELIQAAKVEMCGATK